MHDNLPGLFLTTILGFDYGQKKIGLAVGNDITGNCEELTTISCHRGVPNWAVLDKLIDQWKPDLLIIGLPLNMDGNESKISRQVRSFGENLGKRYNLKYAFEDERLSSNEADKLVREIVDQGKRLNKRLIMRRDQIAAKLITQGYLNRI